jgi:hypothetical protein
MARSKGVLWTLLLLSYFAGCGRFQPPLPEDVAGCLSVEDQEGRSQDLAALGQAGNHFILVFRPGCSACKRILKRLRDNGSRRRFVGLAAVSRPYLEKYVAESAPDFPVYLTTENRLFQAGIRRTPALLIWRGDYWQIEYDSDIIVHTLHDSNIGEEGDG